MPHAGVGSRLALDADSFLRRVDPRTKVALALSASAAVALPLMPLALFGVAFGGLLVAAGVAAQAVGQLRRAWMWLAVLFLLDCAFVGLDFAALITLRLALLNSTFILVLATTTPDELRAAGERCGLPPRLAFALASAFRSLALVEREWQGILEAQRARGIGRRGSEPARWRLRREDLTRVAALVVPAIVLAAQRAWWLSEAAAARGFESPLRRPYAALRLGALDRVFLVAAVAVLAGSLLLR